MCGRLAAEALPSVHPNKACGRSGPIYRHSRNLKRHSFGARGVTFTGLLSRAEIMKAGIVGTGAVGAACALAMVLRGDVRCVGVHGPMGDEQRARLYVDESAGEAGERFGASCAALRNSLRASEARHRGYERVSFNSAELHPSSANWRGVATGRS